MEPRNLSRGPGIREGSEVAPTGVVNARASHGGAGRFAVVVRLECGDMTFDRLTIGPGVGFHRLEHDMVILDVEPTTAS